MWHEVMSRILFVCNEYPPAQHGGQGTFVRQMARLLSEHHAVFVIGFYAEVELPITERDGAVHVHRYPHPGYKGSLGIVKNLYFIGTAINKFIREHQIQIVEFPDSGALFLFVRKRIPVFVRLHNTERYFQHATKKKRSGVLELLENISFWQKLHIVSVSEYIKHQFLKYYKISAENKRRLKTIHNGIDLSFFRYGTPILQRSRKRVVYAGTIKPIKGVGFLIRAFLKLAAIHPWLELHIYGNDNKVGGRSYIEILVEETGIGGLLNKTIFFHGAISNEDIAKVYGDTYLCVFPSLGESFGLVVVEAMASGCIVVSSAYAAGKELIVDGYDGFLVFPDNIDQLAERMQIALTMSDPESMSMAARRSARDKFSLEQCLKKTEDFYKSAQMQYETR